MSAGAPLQGLNCPRCGGIVSIADGQSIVRCSFCDMRSFVHGEHGVRRYQVRCVLNHDDLIAAHATFLSSSLAIAHDARRLSQVSDTFLAYVPFWMVNWRALGYAFGTKKVSRDHVEPREVQLLREQDWNGAACDLSLFGLSRVPLRPQQLEPYDARALREQGMVFDVLGSAHEAQTAARETFTAELRALTNAAVDSVTQVFTRVIGERISLVYYPLWVLRYDYRGRAFQLVIDGTTGRVLYGRAPGSVYFRAALLVLGAALACSSASICSRGWSPMPTKGSTAFICSRRWRAARCCSAPIARFATANSMSAAIGRRWASD